MFRLIPTILMLSAVALRAEVPRLLQDAIQKVVSDTERWAYTQTVVEKDDKGKTRHETVVRFDPSRPYQEQFKPLKFDGKEPPDSLVRKYRAQGERRGTRLEATEGERVDPRHKTVGELMDLERAAIAEETPQYVTYEVPLKKEGNRRFPPEKFLVTARINKEQRAFENIAVKLREPMREKLIVKIKSGEGSLDFAPVDPKYAPQITSIRGQGAASILFVPFGRAYELKREEFKRVKPYGDRFDVKIGPLKAIDFE